MPTMTEANTTFAGHYDAMESFGPSWLTDLRTAAWRQFLETGFPTRKTEGWRQTDLRPITEGAFVTATPDVLTKVDADTVQRFAIPGLDAHTLVFVDGIYAADLSDIGDVGDGVVVSSLAEAIENLAALVEQHLAKHADTAWDAFVALNTAMMSDGAFVHVADGKEPTKPILLLFISTDSATPIVSHPRVLYVVGNDAKAEVVENHVALGESVYFTNAVTEVVVGERAHPHHYYIEDDSEQSYNVSTLTTHQSDESDFSSHTILLGGKLVRNNCHPIIDGSGVDSLLNGLYMPDGDRHHDNAMYVHHTKPGSESRQHYTGILRDKATSVFSGRIKVERAAQQTDAVQASRNLLMSEDAVAHSQPQLEIFADDVKCTHGATIGQLDDEQLFYLRSRGIPEEMARGILVYAFASESMDRMELKPVADHLSRKMIQHLNLGSAEAVVS